MIEELDRNQISNWEIQLEQLILKKYSRKVIVQTIPMSFIQSQKSFMTLYLLIELTIYPKYIAKIYFYLQNYLLMKQSNFEKTKFILIK